MEYHKINSKSLQWVYMTFLFFRGVIVLIFYFYFELCIDFNEVLE